MRKRGGNQLIFQELTPVKSVIKYMRTCKPIEVYIVDKDFETSSFYIKRSQEDSLPRQRGCQQHLLNDSSVTTKKFLPPVSRFQRMHHLSSLYVIMSGPCHIILYKLPDNTSL
ncbi:hypothetical protein ABG067_005981 [Albugo candida]